MATEDEDALDRARSRAEAFDDLVRTAVVQQCRATFPAEFADSVADSDPVLKWDIRELIELYIAGNAYPLERLPGVADRAIDLKLQYRFVTIAMGFHNSVVSGTEFDSRDPLKTPGAHLAHLCVMQILIGQTRVLWERLMTLVYYLEEGEDPHGKSIRRTFFKQINGVDPNGMTPIEHWSNRWDVFREWESVIGQYDSEYRTPEYHNRSRLRKELFGGPFTDPNAIMAPLSPVMSGFWEVLTANVRGVQPHVVRLGRSVLSGLDDGD